MKNGLAIRLLFSSTAVFLANTAQAQTASETPPPAATQSAYPIVYPRNIQACLYAAKLDPEHGAGIIAKDDDLVVCTIVDGNILVSKSRGDLTSEVVMAQSGAILSTLKNAADKSVLMIASTGGAVAVIGGETVPADSPLVPADKPARPAFSKADLILGGINLLTLKEVVAKLEASGVSFEPR